MRLIFMGTPHFAVPALQALLDAGHDVVAVYSQPPRPAGRGQQLTPSPVHQLAESHSIPVHTPISLKSEEEQAIFAAYQADAAIVAAYGLLLPQAILDAPKSGCINIHPSNLPRWRGAAPIQRTIMAGDTSTAMCIMQMEAGLDTGPVLSRTPVDIAPGTTGAQLHDQMSALGATCLVDVLATLESITPEVQATEGVTYASKVTKAESPINWAKPAPEIQQHILGLNPAPAANFTFNGEVVKVLRAEAIECHTATPGLLLTNDGVIACGSGALKLIEIQRPGKKPMLLRDALHGWHLAAGTQLEF